MKTYKSIYQESMFDVTPENSFVKEFLEILSQTKLYHWQTFNYPAHQALGSYYDSMSDLIDKFVESYQGTFGREYISNGLKSDLIGLADLPENSIVTYISSVKTWIKKFQTNLTTIDNLNTSDLVNQLDEMLTETNKLLYLLTMNETTYTSRHC